MSSMNSGNKQIKISHSVPLNVVPCQITVGAGTGLECTISLARPRPPSDATPFSQARINANIVSYRLLITDRAVPLNTSQL